VKVYNKHILYFFVINLYCKQSKNNYEYRWSYIARNWYKLTKINYKHN